MELVSRDTPYGMSLALSGIALVCLGALTFLGLDYHFEGKLLLPVLLVIVGVAMVIWCLVKVCKMKQDLSARDGMLKEAFFSAIVCAVIFGASVPVSTFIRVLDHKEEFQTNIDSTVQVVKTIGETYQTYAKERVANYQRHLQSLSTSSSAYRVELEGASGANKWEKAKSVSNSLQRRLLNDDMLEVEKQRMEWLEGMHDVNVWNVFTPRNISAISNAGSEWVEEYRVVSEIIYSGETAEPFSMPELSDRISQLAGAYTAFTKPNLRGILISLLSFILIMTPYFLTRRNTRSKSGTHK